MPKGYLVTLQKPMFNFISKLFLDHFQQLGLVDHGAVAGCLAVQTVCIVACHL